MPITTESRFQPKELRVLILRRLRQPLRPLDSDGHDRAACPLAGVLGRRGFSLENATTRVCWEARDRVTTNIRIEELAPPPLRQVHNRRLEVVVDGLPLFLGAQPIDTTVVSQIRRDGTARRQCTTVSGAFFGSNQKAQGAHPPRVGAEARSCPFGGSRLRSGGRLSEESRQFLASLAAAKARCEPEIMMKSTSCAGIRWCTLIVCTDAKAFSLSLLEPRLRQSKWWRTTSVTWSKIEERWACTVCSSIEWVFLSSRAKTWSYK